MEELTFYLIQEIISFKKSTNLGIYRYAWSMRNLWENRENFIMRSKIIFYIPFLLIITNMNLKPC